MSAKHAAVALCGETRDTGEEVFVSFVVDYLTRRMYITAPGARPVAVDETQAQALFDFLLHEFRHSRKKERWVRKKSVFVMENSRTNEVVDAETHPERISNDRS